MFELVNVEAGVTYDVRARSISSSGFILHMLQQHTL